MSKSVTERLLVALSGGVDSSVSAALLKDQGHEVEGVYVRTWEHEEDLLGDCPGAKDLADAEAVAEALDIPFRVVNFIDFYQREVVLPMVNGYEDGITPNPDVLCNRSMKFGALLEYARENGFDGLATGHYCIRKKTVGEKPELWEGCDKNKDQSYFLARITPDQLSGARFPLGEIEKPRGREIARELNLPVADKKDSQGICFLGKVKVPEFLSNFIDDKPGDIVTTKGVAVGRHQGLHRYTLGQRRGIGVPSNTDHENFVVTGKEESSNRLIVAFESPDEPTLWGRRYEIENLSFLLDQPLSGEVELLGKTRYRDPSVDLSFRSLDPGRAEVIFREPQRALAPGQVLALYYGERLLGGGTYALSSCGRADLPLLPCISA
ncbi:MAG: tRNA 2-thiouridine(34) synthase MnmA [Opitutae bacterium]|nr:tRNA 2-thiouridine(34) synthase MnmA [Opitutae bacterium]